MNKDYIVELDETIKGGIVQDTLNKLIQITIASIGPKVTWDHFETYLATKISDEDPIFDNLHSLIFTHFQDRERSEEVLGKNLFKLSFDNAQSAQAFFSFTQHTFPIIKTEYPKLNNKEIILTEEQLFFVRRAAKIKTGELPSDFLSDYYLKTLRADRYDYSNRYLKGLFPGPNNTRRLQNLRPNHRLNYIVESDGTISSRADKAASLKSKKEGYTQIQSCTYLDSKALIPVFGFDRTRNPKLYGTLTHEKEIQPVKLLVEDGGTIGRPFDCYSKKDAKDRSSELRSTHFQRLYSPKELETFKDKKTNQMTLNDTTNEVLARQRINLFRCMICICSDNLEARLLADNFSKEILAYFTEHTKTKGWELNPKFKLPIVFYIKNTAWVSAKRFSNMFTENPLHSIFIYTRAMRKNDSLNSKEISENIELRSEKIKSNHYEFLLGLEKISSELLLEPFVGGTPLVIFMMRKGYVRMLLRLIRGWSTAEINALFDLLISMDHFEKNDRIISYLIMEEAFDLATKIIAATQSNIDELIIDGEERGSPFERNLTSHILHKGNPRHFHYLGLEKTLERAASERYWVSVRLCLKEFPNISQTTIDNLFVAALKHNDRQTYPEIVFLLKRPVNKPTVVKREFQNALQSKTWRLVKLLITYYDAPHELELGNVLIEALRNKQRDVVLAIIKRGIEKGWRCHYGQQHYLSSPLVLGIQAEFSDILFQLLELDNSHTDGFHQARYYLAVDLLHINKSNALIPLLGCANKTRELLDPNNSKLSICYIIFEALFANQPAIAEYRLPSQHRNFIIGMHLFSEVFEETLRYFNFLLYIPNSEPTYIISFFEALVDLSLKYQDISILKTMQSLMNNKFGFSSQITEEMIAKASLAKLSPNNIQIIQLLIKTTEYLDLWKNLTLKVNHKMDGSYRSYYSKSAIIFTLLLTIRDHDKTFILSTDLIKDVFSYSVETSNTILTELIFTNLDLTEKLLDELVEIAIKCSDAPYLLYLFKNYNMTLSRRHFTFFQSRYLPYCSVIIILKELYNKKYHNQFTQWDYYHLWLVGTSYDSLYHRVPTEGRNLLAGILEPKTVRHFTLITLLFNFNNCFKEIYLGSSWPNLQATLENDDLKNRISGDNRFNYSRNLSSEHYNHHQALLDTLNAYLDGTCNMPDEITTYNTFQTTLAILEQGLPITSNLPLFWKSNRGNFNFEMYQYFKDIDDILNRNLTTPYSLTSEQVELIQKRLDETYSLPLINTNY